MSNAITPDLAPQTDMKNDKNYEELHQKKQVSEELVLGQQSRMSGEQYSQSFASSIKEDIQSRNSQRSSRTNATSS